MDGVITLISKSYEQNKIGGFVTKETKNDVFCSLKSISSNEFFSAGQNGHRPDMCFITPKCNYVGEDEIEYENNRYSVYRTYLNGDDIEIYVERKVSNG